MNDLPRRSSRVSPRSIIGGAIGVIGTSCAVLELIMTYTTLRERPMAVLDWTAVLLFALALIATLATGLLMMADIRKTAWSTAALLFFAIGAAYFALAKFVGAPLFYYSWTDPNAHIGALPIWVGTLLFFSLHGANYFLPGRPSKL